MKKLFLVMALFGCTIVLSAQNSEQDLSKLNQEIDSYYDSMIKKSMQPDTAVMRRNMDRFLRMQKEQKEKQKKAAYWRLSFGAIMLVVLIAGVARNRKKFRNH